MSIIKHIRISDELMEKAKPYIKNEKHLSFIIVNALESWVNRQIGHDKKAAAEALLRDSKQLQKILDSGNVVIPRGIVR